MTPVLSGPFFGGLLIGDGAYSVLINVSTFVLFASTVAMLLPAALLDRESASASEKGPT